MYKFTAKPISMLLNLCPTIKKYIDHCQQISQLQQIVCELLPGSLTNKCYVANIRDNYIILSAPDSICCHELKFKQHDLLDAIRRNKNWLHIKGIKITINPTPH